MAKISFSWQFLKDTILLFRRRPLKEIIFGKRVALAETDQRLLEWIRQHPEEFRQRGGRRGAFIALGLAHKGKGEAYLFPGSKESGQESLLVFGDDVEITPGPDLYVYLSFSDDPRQGLGEYSNLGLLKGTKGGQSYPVEKNAEDLARYRTAVIYCKQFETLFTFANLT